MSLLSHRSFWRQNVALDVGTATTRAAIGNYRLIEQPSKTAARRVLRGGVVVDGETAVRLLKPLLAKVRVFGIIRPCVLACAPSDIKRNERELLKESIFKAGASSVVIIPEPLAAAIGAGIDVSSPYAQMIVDIGEGVTDCAIIQSSKILTTCAVRVGCEKIHMEIARRAERNGTAAVAVKEAEMILHPHGVANSALDEILDTVDSFLRDLPHTLGSEIIDSGIWLSGGGALIPGIRERLEQRTGIKVGIVSNPLSAVVEGARAILPVVTALNQWD